MNTTATDEIGDLLAPFADRDTAHLRALRTRLVDAAEREGLVDVAYRVLDTPVGSVLLAATAAGLVRVAFTNQDHDAVLTALAAQVSPRVLLAPSRLDRVSRELDEYFAGRRRSFDVELDLRLAAGFRRSVLDRLRTIGYGHTASYAGVAAGLGHPGAARAVGTACARNPVPIVVPCHRVIRTDGTPGEYAGGPAVKHALLALEGAA
jgi:methylated-DNA-[protein]-cysteine S-methyltransferase